MTHSIFLSSMMGPFKILPNLKQTGTTPSYPTRAATPTLGHHLPILPAPALDYTPHTSNNTVAPLSGSGLAAPPASTPPVSAHTLLILSVTMASKLSWTADDKSCSLRRSETEPHPG